MASEVEWLRHRVQELEASQKKETLLPERLQPIISTPQKPTLTPSETCKGVSLNGLNYGPLSIHYFAHRMSKFVHLDATIHSPPIPNLMNPSLHDFTPCDGLGRVQQDYFLDLFWQSYHVNFPIINKMKLHQIYSALWHSDGSRRKPHPLVDVILALSIYHASVFMPQESYLMSSEVVALAGNAFYLRCQTALNQSLEYPTIISVQSQFFSAVYLAFEGYYNAAQTMIGTAGRIATMIAPDHHHDNDDDTDVASESQLTQIWQSLRVLDIRVSIMLGRPRTTMMYPSTFISSNPPSTWLVYHQQMLLLSETVDAIYATFLDKCHVVFEGNTMTEFYTNPTLRDKCASIMIEEIEKLNAWVAQVPASLRMASTSIREPFSTHHPKLHLGSSNDLIWLQRQRLILECQYHDFCLTLLRPFINFSSTPNPGTSSSASCYISCLDHASTLTNIIFQVAGETEILTGLYEVLQWQQNAAYALAGFAVAYPNNPCTLRARRALLMACEYFETIGTSSPAALRMLNLCRQLDSRIGCTIASVGHGSSMSATIDPVVGEGDAITTTESTFRHTGVTGDTITSSLTDINDISDWKNTFSAVSDTEQLWWAVQSPLTRDVWRGLVE